LDKWAPRLLRRPGCSLPFTHPRVRGPGVHSHSIGPRPDAQRRQSQQPPRDHASGVWFFLLLRLAYSIPTRIFLTITEYNIHPPPAWSWSPGGDADFLPSRCPAIRSAPPVVFRFPFRHFVLPAMRCTLWTAPRIPTLPCNGPTPPPPRCVGPGGGASRSVSPPRRLRTRSGSRTAMPRWTARGSPPKGSSQPR